MRDLFYSVINEDLKVWEEKGGITKDNVDAAKPRGAHYQIINHKLYREDDCMFPARYVISTAKYSKVCTTRYVQHTGISTTEYSKVCTTHWNINYRVQQGMYNMLEYQLQSTASYVKNT